MGKKRFILKSFSVEKSIGFWTELHVIKILIRIGDFIVFVYALFFPKKSIIFIVTIVIIKNSDNGFKLFL